jgi:hypothetical protein
MSVLSISSGELVGECGWPSAAAVWSGPAQCSGVLVHPQVAVIDPTCFEWSPGSLVLQLGDDEAAQAFSVEVDPGACQFQDGIGFCVLPGEVPVPVAPILAGCELLELEVGDSVQLVGFGTHEEGTFSTQKRSGAAEVDSIAPTAIFVVGDHAPCTGDSGSPAFLQLEDGSWRTVGIALTGSCANPSGYRLLTPMIPWIEEASGIDVSPCHDAEGSPELGPACAGFYAGGAGGEGTWDDFCAAAPVGGDGGVCSDDARPPSVQIVTPAAGTDYDAGPVAIELEVIADDAAGAGVRDVRLAVEGQLLEDAATEAPYVFPLVVPEGEWSIVAVARDWAGNEAESEPLVLRVGEVAGGEDETGEGDTGAPTTGASMPDGDADDDGDGDEPDATAGGSDGTSGSDAAQAEDGRGCNVGAGRHVHAVWLLLLVGAWRRRAARAFAPALALACACGESGGTPIAATTGDASSTSGDPQVLDGPGSTSAGDNTSTPASDGASSSSDGEGTSDGGSSSSSSTGDDESSGSSTGEVVPDGPPGPGWEDCVNLGPEVCTDGGLCANMFDAIVGACAEPCASDGDCPAAGGGDAAPTCFTFDFGEQACVLDCTGGATCPDGMHCALGFCFYTLDPLADGQCPDGAMTTDAPVRGSTVGAGDDVTPMCFYTDHWEDVSYTLTVPRTGWYRIDGTASPNRPTLIVQDACGGEQLACASFFAPTLVVELVAGEDVVVSMENSDDYLVTTEFLGDPPAGDCCFANHSVGCSDPAIADCVCAIGSQCCTSEWTTQCAALAETSCDADCDG